MKSPIKIRKHLVRKAPDLLPANNYKIEGLRIREITFKDINDDIWLNERKNAFDKMLSDSQVGHIALNQENECVGYGWAAIGKDKPNHIPKIPNNSAWFHYERVKDDFQGMGIGRLLIEERVRLLRQVDQNIEIYTDTSEKNIPARINQERLGFLESGIYYTIEIGTRRIPLLYGLFGIWKRDKKHPEIKNKNYKQ